MKAEGDVVHSPPTWVVGRGGLLGNQVASVLTGRGAPLWTPERPVRWGTQDAHWQLRDAARALARTGSGFRIFWCAGAAVTGATAETLEIEVGYLRTVLEALRDAEGRGSLFLASSAGGVYAGSSGPPFDERSLPRPLAPYGHAKLEMERLVEEWGAQIDAVTMVGRISNLYGPGQNLAKPQGLIPHLVRGLLLRKPISLYVSTDTLRDHIYVSDCARMAVHALMLAERESWTHDGPVHRLKVLASGEAVTIGHLVAELKRVARVKPLVMYGTSAVSRFQARDLRLASVAMPEVDASPRTPLPVGMRNTLEALARAHQAGKLT